MVRHLCVSLAAAAIVACAPAAEAADLSMTPIYKARPSVAAAVNGSLKAEYRPFTLPDANRLAPAWTAEPAADRPLAPPNDREARAGANERF